MSKNTVERSQGFHVVSMEADATIDIAQGTEVVMAGDYAVTSKVDQDVFGNGVTLAPHASGVYECIPVMVAGPVIRVLAGTGGVSAGDKVAGEAAAPGSWIVDNDDPAGFALEDGADGSYFDMVYIGEIH